VLNILRPRLYLNAVEDINLRQLQRRGIRALILDLDNTLVTWRATRPAGSVVRWVKEARRLGLQPVILSNNHGQRVREVARRLKVPCIPKARKPFGRSYREAMALLGAQPHETAVVGDQVFTDVLGGNRLGLFTILVRPLSRHEFVATKALRRLEAAVLRHMGGPRGGQGDVRPGSTLPSGMRTERT
jgi:HAD superfamily phosphatase (TIGR01668 family)